MGLTFDDIKGFSPEAQKQITQQMLEKGKKIQKPSKMHNVPTTRTMPNGKEYTFQSTKEGKRYDELILLLKAGKIRNLKLQTNCTLIEGYTTPEGERIKPLVYKADFTYERKTEADTYGYPHWIYVVEDVKGKRTKTYLNKRKLFREKFGFDITEV